LTSPRAFAWFFSASLRLRVKSFSLPGIISTREDLVAKDRSPKKEVKKPKKKK